MKTASTHLLQAAAAAILCLTQASAQTPARPTAATAICKDGSFTTTPDRQAACHGHKGIQTWYKADAPAFPPPTLTTAPSLPVPTPVPDPHALPIPTPASTPTLPTPATGTTASLPAPTPATSPQEPVPTTITTAPALPVPQPGHVDVQYGIATERSRILSTPPAPGGGPGLVWLNTATRVYHCPTSDFYGKTKNGIYTSESDARAQGAHPNRNKPCS